MRIDESVNVSSFSFHNAYYDNEYINILSTNTLKRAKEHKDVRPSTLVLIADKLNYNIEDIINYSDLVNAELSESIIDIDYCRIAKLSQWLSKSNRCIRLYINGILANPDRYGTDCVIQIGNRYEAAPLAVLDYMINQYCLQDKDRYEHLMLPYDPMRLARRLKGGIDYVE